MNRITVCLFEGKLELKSSIMLSITIKQAVYVTPFKFEGMWQHLGASNIFSAGCSHQGPYEKIVARTNFGGT